MRRGCARLTAVVRVDGYWELFRDWCAAVGLDPDAANTADVERFGEALSDSPVTTRRRIARVRARLGLRRTGDPGPVGGDVERAMGDVLAATAITGWPDGVRGRRNAAILALRGRMRLTRPQVCSLAASDFRPGFGWISVRGRRVPAAVEPGRCPACAVTRWLRIAAELERPNGWRRLRNDWSSRWPSTAGAEAEHDCARRLPGSWRDFRVLVPAIDRHGWVTEGRPLSCRAISTITNRPAPRDEPPGPREARLSAATIPRAESAWDRVTQTRQLEYLGPLFDQLEREIDEALDRTRTLLRED